MADADPSDIPAIAGESMQGLMAHVREGLTEPIVQARRVPPPRLVKLDGVGRAKAKALREAGHMISDDGYMLHQYYPDGIRVALPAWVLVLAPPVILTALAAAMGASSKALIKNPLTGEKTGLERTAEDLMEGGGWP